jgi:lipopolysaccharide transport system ATP-binding protein
MSDIILRAENIGKRYTLSHQSGGVKYRKISDTLANAVKSPLRFLQAKKKGMRAGLTKEEYWALKDVSFEIKQGEVVGIIGRNGAGKSTLLKVLSRITEPTTGKITINGRIASLLEVGTGFHPELTGRENIFLNGAILGMRKEEIKAKFDEIVAFAEVERFLDTPVKRYSSGMYVRLAFAVAAHLEPEILIIDEVLAVGDAAFQKKCLGKMKDVATAGRTVLFVSHQLDTIRALCSRVILLNSGHVEMEGGPADVVQTYLKSDRCESAFTVEIDPEKEAQITAGSIDDIDYNTGIIKIALSVSSVRPIKASIDLRLMDGLGSPVGFGSLGTIRVHESIDLIAGNNLIVLALMAAHLAVGNYVISFDLTEPFVRYFDRKEQVLQFSIQASASDTRNRSVLQSWGYGSIDLELTNITEMRVPLGLSSTSEVI